MKFKSFNERNRVTDKRKPQYKLYDKIQQI
jgi:hypothetical protein